MKEKIQRPKGTADVSPSQVYKWHFTENLLRRTAALFGYKEIRFPAFEHTELFVRGVGDTTDVVQKEMYTFLDKGGRSITLRPEGTASTVRAYIENGEAQAGAPFKAYYIAPNFRYEKPQAGRLRQHHQFGVECFGAASFAADAEVISLANSFIKALGIGTTLHLNSIGCPHCRPAYHKALKEYFSSRRDELCDTCRERLEKNPMRILDCKSEICKEIAKDAPKTLDYLCDECREHFDGLRGQLEALGIPYVVDSHIVRGLDYYTKTVFEFIATNIGAQSTVCAGGRYDGLIEELGGAATPAVGFGCGLERLMLAAEGAGFVFPGEEGCRLYLIGADERGRQVCALLASRLREKGISCETDLCQRTVKAQMKHAGRTGASFTCVIGENEVQAGQLSIKNMESGETCTCPLDAEAVEKAVL